jgi:2-dehydropantoate 2-reductase
MSAGNDRPLGAGRVLIVGAGSLGSVYGAFLARAGHDVQLLAREPHARAVQERGGLVLETSAGSTLVPARAEWMPERVEQADIMIVLTKTPDTEAALSGLEHIRSGLRLAVSLQNGVEKDDVLARWCGSAAVGGVSMVGGTLIEPGVVRHTFLGRTIVGELPRGTSPRVERFAALLERSGLEAVVAPDVRSIEWTKLVHAVPTMALTALARLPFHEALLSPDLAPAFVALAREGASVAAAAGARLDDETMRFPIKSIATAPDAEAVALVQEQGRRMERAGMTDVRVSMLQSIERGRRTEVEAIHGYVTREGARLGVAVPRIELCYSLLAAIDRRLA